MAQNGGSIKSLSLPVVGQKSPTKFNKNNVKSTSSTESKSNSKTPTLESNDVQTSGTILVKKGRKSYSNNRSNGNMVTDALTNISPKIDKAVIKGTTRAINLASTLEENLEGNKKETNNVSNSETIHTDTSALKQSSLKARNTPRTRNSTGQFLKSTSTLAQHDLDLGSTPYIGNYKNRKSLPNRILAPITNNNESEQEENAIVDSNIILSPSKSVVRADLLYSSGFQSNLGRRKKTELEKAKVSDSNLFVKRPESNGKVVDYKSTGVPKTKMKGRRAKSLGGANTNVNSELDPPKASDTHLHVPRRREIGDTTPSQEEADLPQKRKYVTRKSANNSPTKKVSKQAEGAEIGFDTAKLEDLDLFVPRSSELDNPNTLDIDLFIPRIPKNSDALTLQNENSVSLPSNEYLTNRGESSTSLSSTLVESPALLAVDFDKEQRAKATGSRPLQRRKSLPVKTTTTLSSLQPKLVKVDTATITALKPIKGRKQTSGIKNVFDEIVAQAEAVQQAAEAEPEKDVESELELSTKLGGNWRPHWRYTTAEAPDFVKEAQLHEKVNFEGRLTRTKYKELAPTTVPEVVEYAPVFTEAEDNVVLQPSKFEIVRFLPITKTVKTACMFNIISEYDDLLTNLLVDSVYLNFTTHKFRADFEEKCLTY